MRLKTRRPDILQLFDDEGSSSGLEPIGGIGPDDLRC